MVRAALDDAHMMRKSRLTLRAYVGAMSILMMHGWIALRDRDEYPIPFLRWLDLLAKEPSDEQFFS